MRCDGAQAGCLGRGTLTPLQAALRGREIAYVADPLVHDRITPRLARFILDGGALVRRLAPLWRVPTLLLWAGADRCVAPRGSATFAQAAPAGVVEAQDYPALAHEIFHEPEREAVLARLQAWLSHVG